MQTTKNIVVLQDRYQEAVAVLKKLAKKAAKYGNDAVTWQQTGTTTVPYRYENTKGEIVVGQLPAYVISVSGNAPQINGYKFLARVEFIGENENLIHHVPTNENVVVDAKFRTTKSFCEHCNKIRNRNDVFVIENEVTGEQKQVGRSCLHDYLGIDDPKVLIETFGFWREISGIEEEYLSYPDKFFNVVDIIAFSLVSSRLYGFVSKRAAEERQTLSTSSTVYDALTNQSNSIAQEIRNNCSESDVETAQKVIDSVMQSDKSSDYLNNLRVLLNAKFVKSQHIALVASAVTVYNSAVPKITKQTTNEFFGNVGDKISIKATIESVKYVDSMYGASALVTFKDGDNRTFITFNSGSTINWSEIKGTERQISATIKAHNEYNNMKQTVLTRVKLK